MQTWRGNWGVPRPADAREDRASLTRASMVTLVSAFVVLSTGPAPNRVTDTYSRTYSRNAPRSDLDRDSTSKEVERWNEAGLNREKITETIDICTRPLSSLAKKHSTQDSRFALSASNSLKNLLEKEKQRVLLYNQKTHLLVPARSSYDRACPRIRRQRQNTFEREISRRSIPSHHVARAAKNACYTTFFKHSPAALRRTRLPVDTHVHSCLRDAKQPEHAAGSHSQTTGYIRAAAAKHPAALPSSRNKPCEKGLQNFSPWFQCVDRQPLFRARVLYIEHALIPVPALCTCNPHTHVPLSYTHTLYLVNVAVG